MDSAAQDRADAPCTRCGATAETGQSDECPECRAALEIQTGKGEYARAVERARELNRG